MDSKLYMIEFVQKCSPQCVNEMVYPFGNYKSDYFNTFLIYVKSPSQYYYTDIFASFILSSDEAWKLFKLLLDTQQVDDVKICPNRILEMIPDHLSTLESQFKKYYNLAMYKVTSNLDFK